MNKDRYQQELLSFGIRLKAIRTEKSLTQLDLAEEMKIERSEISKMENGKLNIEFKTIVKLADALQIEIADLFAAPTSTPKNHSDSSG